MKLVSRYGAVFGLKEGVAFQYKHFGIDYRIFVIERTEGFTWELSRNYSSYGNRYEVIYVDDEIIYKSVEAAKRAAYRALKLETSGS